MGRLAGFWASRPGRTRLPAAGCSPCPAAVLFQIAAVERHSQPGACYQPHRRDAAGRAVRRFAAVAEDAIAAACAARGV